MKNCFIISDKFSCNNTYQVEESYLFNSNVCINMLNSWNHAAGTLLGNSHSYFIEVASKFLSLFFFWLNRSTGEMTYLDFGTTLILMGR